GSATGVSGLQPSDQSNIDPKLQALQTDAASQTRLFVPRSDSPAIDGGPAGPCLNAQGSAYPFDQRQVARPLNGNQAGAPRCDIGAYEFAPATAAPDGTVSYPQVAAWR